MNMVQTIKFNDYAHKPSSTIFFREDLSVWAGYVTALNMQENAASARFNSQDDGFHLQIQSNRFLTSSLMESYPDTDENNAQIAKSTKRIRERMDIFKRAFEFLQTTLTADRRLFTSDGERLYALRYGTIDELMHHGI